MERLNETRFLIGEKIVSGKDLSEVEKGKIYIAAINYTSKLIDRLGEPRDGSLKEGAKREYLNYMVFHRIAFFAYESIEKNINDSDSMTYLGELKSEICDGFGIKRENLEDKKFSEYLKDVLTSRSDEDIDEEIFKVINKLRDTSSRIVKR